MADIQKVNYGTPIKYYRKQRGYSQAKLAEEVGCTQSAISRIERNEVRSDDPLLLAISRVLEFQYVEYFQGIDNHTEIGDSPEEISKVEFENEILRLMPYLRQLPGFERVDVLGQMKYKLDKNKIYYK